MSTAQSPASSRSEAELSRSAQVGGVLFRNRSWLPVPFVAIPLLWPTGPEWWHAHMSPITWGLGLLLVAIGEWVRLAGVAAAGTVTRRRSRDVGRLVTYGIFAWVRNPLYIGNLLAWLGFTVVSGLLWFIPVAIVIFAIEYTYIVRYEEGVLESTFGDEYLAYKARTPRWIPRTPQERETGPHDYGEAIRSEVSTLLQYVVLILIFLAKERIWGR
jgi:protein-S-isoprenylcysteine O-methyltransferase Ste14